MTNKIKEWLSQEVSREEMSKTILVLLVISILFLVGSFVIAKFYPSFEIKPLYIFLTGFVFLLSFLIALISHIDLGNFTGVSVFLVLLIGAVFLILILLGIVPIPIISASGGVSILPTNTTLPQT